MLGPLPDADKWHYVVASWKLAAQELESWFGKTEWSSMECFCDAQIGEDTPRNDVKKALKVKRR